MACFPGIILALLDAIATAASALVGFPLPNNVLPVGAEVSVGLIGGPPIFPGPPTPLDVTYAGPAPGLLAGTTQINFNVGAIAGGMAITLPMARSGFLLYVASQ